MVDPHRLAQAELSYQRGLTALHQARAELDVVAAARRRLAYDPADQDPESIQRRAEALERRHADLVARVEQLRRAAEELRAALRRQAGPGTLEPADPDYPPTDTDFQQPPGQR